MTMERTTDILKIKQLAMGDVTVWGHGKRELLQGLNTQGLVPFPLNNIRTTDNASHVIS